MKVNMLRKMKILIYGVLLMTIYETNCTPVQFSNIFSTNEECGLNKDFFQGCSDDCTSQAFCISNHYIELNCNLQTNNQKPYCNQTSNICQSSPVNCGNDSSEPPTEFQCPFLDGSYPNPLDCGKFYDCKNKIPYPGECVEGKFNPKIPGCSKVAKCYQFSPENGLCKNKIGKFVLHPLDANVVVKCENYPVVMRCPTKHIFVLKTEQCQYDCKVRGIFPDYDKKEYYFICEKVGLYWQPKHVKCDNGMYFDENFVGCISIPVLPDSYSVLN